ncbi:4Fe-4S dicluster domain-containing protein [Ferrimonas pelagia]|uniref:4Fe-4S dicluster domain-containing protein n=1 Tax=Ferrimonas pelagia TaxID=1177826 RepID=A0ABP9F0P5_9GAMM
MTKQLAFVFRQENCVGCEACTVACQAKNKLDEKRMYRQISCHDRLSQQGRSVQVFLSQSCHHCENPYCVKACAYGVYSKRADGIVVQNLENCVGCGQCVRDCPHGALAMEDINGRNRATKCDMCAELIDAGEKPACVRGCPVQVLDVMPLEEAVQLPGAQLYGHGYSDFGNKPNTVIIRKRS